MADGAEMIDEPPVPDDVAAQIRCVYCGTTGAVRVQWKDEYHTRPIGTYSFAGDSLKASVRYRPWPYATCRQDITGNRDDGTPSPGCGHISRGRVTRN